MTETKTCRIFIPLVSEINGPTRHCSQCGRLESEHGDAPAQPMNGRAPRRRPVDWIAIPNADRGQFQFTIVEKDTMRNVAQVFAQLWKDHAKVADDPEASRNAALLATAPRLLRVGKELSAQAKVLNDLQHAGQEVPAGMWSELYQLVNEMAAVVEEAETPAT